MSWFKLLGFASRSLIASCYMRVKGRAVCLVLLVAFFFPLLAFPFWIWLDCIAWTSSGLQELSAEECLVQLDLLATDGRHTFCCCWPEATSSPQWGTYGSFSHKLKGNLKHESRLSSGYPKTSTPTNKTILAFKGSCGSKIFLQSAKYHHRSCTSQCFSWTLSKNPSLTLTLMAERQCTWIWAGTAILAFSSCRSGSFLGFLMRASGSSMAGV